VFRTVTTEGEKHYRSAARARCGDAGVTWACRLLLLLLVMTLPVVVAYKVMHWGLVRCPIFPLSLYGSAIGIFSLFVTIRVCAVVERGHLGARWYKLAERTAKVATVMSLQRCKAAD